MITLTSCTSPSSIWRAKSSKDIALDELRSCAIFLFKRSSAILRAFFSESNALKISPATGTSFNPMISTGIEGKASFSSRPRSSVILRTRPNTVPTTKASPVCKVPFCTSNVVTGPRPLSNFASITVPVAILLGFALKFSTSATIRIVSNKSGTPSPNLADTST